MWNAGLNWSVWRWCWRLCRTKSCCAALERRRGRGRDDYPIRAMRRALVAGIVFQHVSVESLLRELRRNPGALSGCVRV